MKKIKVYHSNKEFLVDDEDFEELNKYNWSISPAGYVNRQVQLSREIIKAPKGVMVDHIDGNQLNNQKSNLRLCTQQQNNFNRKKRPNQYGYKGVSIDKHNQKNKYRVQIGLKKKFIGLGSFSDSKTAGLVYDLWATYFHGEFANTNFEVKAVSSEIFEDNNKKDQNIFIENAIKNHIGNTKW